MKMQSSKAKWRFTAGSGAAALIISSVVMGFGMGQAQAAEKRPAPPMGWNSYTGYSIAVTEEELLKNIDFLSEKLLKYGYDTVTVDNGWFLSGQGEGITMALDEYGRPESHAHFFPHGLKYTIDYAHQKGVKFGIWLLRGINRRAVEENLPVKGTKYRMQDIVNMKSRCGWAAKPWWNYGVDMTKPGAQEYYDGLVQKYADLGVDFIKFDDMVPSPVEVDAAAKAIAKCGRPIVLSLSPGDSIRVEHSDAYKKANMVRITSDIWDNKGSLEAAFHRWEAMQTYTGPEAGSFLDMDMVCFGRLGVVNKDGGRECKFTPDQKRTFMVQRALAASPLMLGGVLYSMDDFSMSLFTNADILRCDQNGVIGRLVHRDGKLDVWKTSERGNENNGWIGVFNRDGGKKMNVELSAKHLGLNPEQSYRLKNLWTGEDLPIAGQHAIEIPSDGVVFLSYRQDGQAAPRQERERVVQPVVDHALRINGPGVCGVWPGTPFFQAIPATGTRPMEFSAKGLPPGLKVDPATGFITGSIEKPGEYVVTLRVENQSGSTERPMRIVCGEKLALTPPMGWMSWNLFGCDINEDKIRALAEAMVTAGLCDVGYQYVAIDDCWAYKRASDGSLLADEKRFPQGIKALADYVHARGLKLGIYSDAAEQTCAGAMGSYGHEEQDARTFAEWGVDYLKYDYCGAPGDRETAIKRYKVMAQALRKSGRSIVFSVCEWGDRQPWLWAGQAGGNLWRTTWDIRDTWETVKYNNGSAGIMNILDHQVGLAKYAGPGGWNDPDMLVVGLNAKSGPAARGRGCTDTEYRANMSLWCLLAAPLFAACDLRTMSATTRETLTHLEILALNQDPLGKPADRIGKDGDREVWARPLADGSMAVGLLNRDAQAAHKIKVQWSDLGLRGGQAVRDLWKGRDLGVCAGPFETQVEPHEVV
ncbi:MAG: alpha-galactosidase, partial [Kiritimatiellaeota bacterium]|nr:alpha-galactosidase [Kiritimatiellota bacterium]